MCRWYEPNWPLLGDTNSLNAYGSVYALQQKTIADVIVPNIDKLRFLANEGMPLSTLHCFNFIVMSCMSHIYLPQLLLKYPQGQHSSYYGAVFLNWFANFRMILKRLLAIYGNCKKKVQLDLSHEPCSEQTVIGVPMYS